MRTREECKGCGQQEYEKPGLICKNCLSHWHVDCALVTEDEAKLLLDWYCMFCLADNQDLDISWLPTPSVEGPEAVRNFKAMGGTSSYRPPLKTLSQNSQSSSEPEPQPGPSHSRATPVSQPISLSSDEETTQPREIVRNSRTAKRKSKNDPNKEHPMTEILDVHFQRNKPTEYLVLWADGTQSYEPEENCRGCVEKVNEFRASKGLAPCKLVPRYGASTDKGYNNENWVTMDQVKAAIEQYDRVKDGFPPVKDFSPDNDGICIQLLGLSNHIYVIHRSPVDNKLYIADGTNSYLETRAATLKVNAIIGKHAIGIKFVGQNFVDHCASSAVMIALEFRRTYRTKTVPQLLKAEKSTYERVKKLFHHYQSSVVTQSKPLRNLEPDVCQKCGKRFPKANRRGFIAHQNKCLGPK